MSPPIITLTSDFGMGPFVGFMKGVILAICPQARLVDLSHAVPAQDVRAGAVILEQALDVFGPGTIHLAVVDPGVGTARRAICLAGLDMLFVGPDNGLFTPVLLADPGAKTYLLSEKRFFRREVSNTFHGRDIFAPVAGHLAAGVKPADLGSLVSDPIRLDWPLSRLEKGVLLGQVLGADDFGNLYTNLTRRQVEGYLAGRQAEVGLGEIRIKGLSLVYGQARPGEVLALFNSWDRLELAVNQGNLLKFLGLKPDGIYGLKVEVKALAES